ncbi:MAG: hypothetical protein BWZ08_01966 [candidate division BRC1 bacterium ADurb.BinA292]|nr:MAG: hypothetical protein BWZ08_01966 [candidate division BRC1 bacterium ADurb.BinA292]
MKHVVVTNDLREADIRPPEILSEFMRLSIAEAARFFDDPADLIQSDCPACASEAHEPVFTKHGFEYEQCLRCQSVFVARRPAPERLEDYYRNSRAVRYRAETFTQATGPARRLHIQRAHANWLGRLYDECGGAGPGAYADVGTHYPMLFEEVRGLGLFAACHTINPLPGLEDACRQAGAATGALPAPLAAISSFEQLEHQFSPLEYLMDLNRLLAPGGMIFLTTRTISGFDLQVLWDQAPYIYVPEHLNLLSVEGLELLFGLAGLEVVELSTPGQLDLELIREAAARDPHVRLPAFVRYLLERREPRTHEDFQHFLQRNRLSSHVRIAAVKSPAGEA